jgi:hypothetical protein
MLSAVTNYSALLVLSCTGDRLFAPKQAGNVNGFFDRLIYASRSFQFAKLTAVFGEERKVLFAKLNDVFTGRSLQSVAGVMESFF